MFLFVVYTLTMILMHKPDKWSAISSSYLTRSLGWSGISQIPLHLEIYLCPAPRKLSGFRTPFICFRSHENSKSLWLPSPIFTFFNGKGQHGNNEQICRTASVFRQQIFLPGWWIYVLITNSETGYRRKSLHDCCIFTIHNYNVVLSSTF